jgi:hypothetical protein
MYVYWYMNFQAILMRLYAASYPVAFDSPLKKTFGCFGIATTTSDSGRFILLKKATLHGQVVVSIYNG